jgi:hypothetical protein
MARRRRLAPKVVVSSGNFVRAVILPLRRKIVLVERRKVVERDPTYCGRFTLQAPQRRRSHSLVGGELWETNPRLFFVVCLTHFDF